MPRTPVVRDRRTALYGGIVALVIGSLLLHDAFEARGRSRPWVTKLLPGG